MRLAILLAAASAALSGCCALPQPSTVACLPLKPYTSAEQSALADALAALPPGSSIIQAVLDYGAMRDADRACLHPTQ